MARALRYDDPRCGREHFDSRAGVDWDWGPDPNDTTCSILDFPWNRYKRTLEPPNRILFSNNHWAVTVFNLEPLYSTEPERYEGYTMACLSQMMIRLWKPSWSFMI
jgi:hypothetical protein